MRQHRRPSRSLLLLAIRYTEQRDNGLFYYQRAVPTDLRNRLPTKIIKVPLGTTDPAVALKKVKLLNAKHERQWDLLRADPNASAEAAEVQALHLLLEHGLTPHAPTQDEAALDALLRPFEAAREAYAGDCDETYRQADPRSYLGPVEVAALDLLKPKKDKLKDALEVYLRAHQKGDDENRRKVALDAITCFITAVGDHPVLKIEREHVRSFIEYETARGRKTGTTRRRLTELRAIMTRYLIEKKLNLKVPNPFSDHSIKGEGEDAEDGSPLSAADWSKLVNICRTVDDSARWAIALQMATGARIGEIVGLELEEIILDGPVPWVVITRNSARGIKTDKAANNGRRKKDSFRGVPLVGVALWAAKRIHDTAVEGQVFAFPQYVGEDGKVKNDSASATLNKWIKAQGFDHTSHDFRHTMRDRLRNTGCPDEAAREIGGWAKEFVGDKVYGDGRILSIRQKHLQAAVGES